ncbi:UDP-4-amino-4,6-dideoxy-N-acetyl-beta-L-altrosamine transaminase [Herbaspirillum lusitanum]|uniref:UDP-4-amino-4, 6-dideoxy-N-acetyl-beta-L-altrosamine transaminase n=1 Tax=Herbaspirillum lusitanum TaxID=213312 RepID=UPI002237D857|nr:UDP-4-amino-4,6-dideoxy-N-acetyl-beta-L-altrosamine transaminase [Herbaspirillum lusitanum]MCW5300593.1 UDP-4-amino-4,6-dideoxy-N-acetyl-beta-L-altrosamine transaminase [Herbaspirillum lusitanum]
MVIPYGRQDISAQDIQAVVDTLTSDWITQGPAISRFEDAIASRCGGKHAIAVSNATAALHLSCLALGVGPGDIVWTSPNTFVASTNCALYCGATVDFVDIDPRTYNLCAEKLQAKLQSAQAQGRLPKVVIAVHFAGQSCDMRAIKDLADQYDFRIIEDASHAVGGKYLDEPIGNCRYSDVVIFSFHPVKIITTAEGGMVLTRDDALAKSVRQLRTHGITSDPADMVFREPGEIWNYQQTELGFNYRMTDIQAALGASQAQRLEEFVARRHAIARRYDELLEKLPVITPWQHPDSYSGFHLYVIRLDLTKIERTHKQVYEAMRAVGVLVNIHYIPVYRQPYYEKMGFKKGYCPEAEQYYAETLSLPLFPTLTAEEQDFVVDKLGDILAIPSVASQASSDV